MNKVIVLGKTGMLGSMVERVLRESGGEVLGTQMDDASAPGYFDVTHGIDALQKVVDELGGCDYFVNCIGITANLMKNASPKMMDLAIRVNSVFPQELSGFAESVSAKVLHMSTDGVFRLDRKDVKEDDPHDCLDAYGKTKSLGEADAINVLNIRTSIIGPSPEIGGGLYEWFMSQPDGAEISGYTNQMWNGVTTRQFAEFCARVMNEGAFEDVRREGKACHFVPNEAVTKYKLLQICKEVTKKNIVIKAREGEQVVARTLISTSNVMRNFSPSVRGIRTAIHAL